MMNKIKFLLILLVVGALGLNAQDPENNPIITSVPTLSITPDARSSGMGDVGAATTPDVNSMFYNPAKYAFMEGNTGLSFTFTPWLSKLVSDINLAYLAGFYRLDDRRTLSSSLRYFSLGEIMMYNPQGDEQGTVQPNELAFDLGYSQKLSENFSASAVLRLIYSDLNNGMNFNGGVDIYPGFAVAADISAYYRLPVAMSTGNGLFALGLNASNIGSKISYDQDYSYFIPTNLRIGASFDYPIDEYQKISFSADANKLMVPTPDGTDQSTISPLAGIFSSFNDAPGGMSEELREIYWSAGAEYAYNNQFFVRGGYFFEDQYKGNRKYFTAGAGFKLNVFQLDFSYIISTIQTNPLDGTMRFSLSFDMNGLQNLMK